MTFDEEIYHLIGQHLRKNNAPISQMMAVLTNHLTMMIQSCILPIESKLKIADELTGIMRLEIQKDPHPMTRRLN